MQCKKWCLFKGVSLTVKVLVLSLLISAVVWTLLDYKQSRTLWQLFVTELTKELEKEAKENRLFFDRQVQSHHIAAKLIMSQQRFHDYIFRADWRTHQTIKHHYRPPSWLPRSSVMRAFFNARYAILINRDGQVQEVYYYFPEKLPPSLLEPDAQLQKLSHSQSYMTTIDDFPYVLTAQSIKNDDGEVIATLMLASPLDDDFLMASMGTVRSEQIVSLLGGSPRRVIASSNPDVLPKGTLAKTLEEKYVMIGKSFFDYGASDLKIQFVSYVPIEKAHHLANDILKKERKQRAILALILVALFFILTFWMVYRIKSVTREMVSFSMNNMGIEKRQGGDEITEIVQSFQQLKERIENTIAQANAIALGDYYYTIKDISKHDKLGYALSEMTLALRDATQNSVMQDWLKTGQTQLNERMSGEQETAELAGSIITCLVSYLKVPVGLFYLADEKKQCVKLLASHGYNRRKRLANVYQFGDGLAGQVALERQAIVLTQPPEDYINLLFKADEAVVQNLLAIPFLYENTLMGVIELVFLTQPTEIQREFLSQIMTSIAIAMHTAESRTQMRAILNKK